MCRRLIKNGPTRALLFSYVTQKTLSFENALGNEYDVF